MNLNCETILDFYMYKNKKILCQIKGKYCKDLKFKNTCRSLTQEQWNTFDKKLEKLITTTENWNDESFHQFNINPYIEVNVKKSKLSLKQFYICLDALGDCDKHDECVVEANYVLECLFNFQYEVEFHSSIDSQEYVPQIKDSSDGKLCSALTYEPYTPSKKQYPANNNKTIKTSRVDFLDGNTDTYSPKPLFEMIVSDSLITEKIPKYTPAPIKSNTSTLRVVTENKDEIKLPQKYYSSKSKLSKKIESEYIPKSKQFALVDVPVYIPTPIDEITTRQKLLKTQSTIRKRSKTIDEVPLQLIENTKEKYKIIQERLDKETPSRYEKKILIKRSKTIDEIPAAFTGNNIAIEENRDNSYIKLRSADKTTNQKSKEKKNLPNENISITKEKAIQSESKTKRWSLLKGDEILYEHKKVKKSLLTSDEKFDEKLKEATTEASQQKIKDQNTNDNTANVITPLRRSERSPSKPHRFIEEQLNLLKKNKLEKQKTSPKNRELFGTDDEDDEIGFEKPETKINDKTQKIKSSSVSEKYHKSSSLSSNSSSKKKRKRDKCDECDPEKRDISKWISKKKNPSSGSSSKSPISKPTIEISSLNELELFRNKTRLKQKENKKERINITKMCTSPAKEVF